MLQVRGLEVHYGGICAVKGVDLDIAAGEKVALIGANGAGKTSTLKAIVRMLPARGSVSFDGNDISQAPPHSLVGRGLALVPEGRGVFARLSVRENLDMGAYARDDCAGIAADMQRVFSLLPRLKERAGQTAGTLSGGEQQMVALGRALMSRQRLLLLDEPSMGLSPVMVDTVFGVIREIAQEGVTLLLVEQNARLALSLCDRGYVMDSGAVTLCAPSAELLDNPAVRAAYLGE